MKPVALLVNGTLPPFESVIFCSATVPPGVATLGIVITLASQGLVSLPAGLAMMLGAEIGTCADTLVATLGRSAAAVRAGVFHLLFNVATVSLGVALIGPLRAFAETTSGEVANQVANAHVAFNQALERVAKQLRRRKRALVKIIGE